MPVSRRAFLRSTACAGAGMVAVERLSPAAILAAFDTPQLSRYLSGMRMAATPATEYRAYRSKPVTNPETPTWVQVDLGRPVAIDAVMLYPASERMYPGRDQYYGGEGFPLRFRIEASGDEDFARAKKIADLSHDDFPDPGDNITRYPATGVTARYLRVTATRLRPVREHRHESADQGGGQGGLQDSSSFTLTLAKIGVIADGEDVAAGCRASADAKYGNSADVQQLTRAARQDGEAIHYDLPQNVTQPDQWKPIRYRAEAPRSGVVIGDGLFRTAMENNIRYLMDFYTTADLLRQFYERTGAIQGYKPTGSAVFWEEDLAGSNAGRFLMGAGNTLRWIDNPDLRQKMTAVMDGIAACRKPNGYIMAYPEDTIFYSERGAYTRAWLTHGLLEAAYAGDRRGFELLRGYYDWFNQQSRYLPELLRGAVQGGQGMIANTRVSLSPAGKAADVQVIQRYFQENAWLEGLARRDPRQIWQYPYDRPHCYLLTDLEAYLDLYRATGEQKYHDAVLGGWEMYREHWEQPGGSISIIEFRRDPPDSNYLHEKLGELCGSSFWVFLSQRFQLMNPEDERFAAEIEKSIYNVALANQDGSQGLRYHTILEGQKEKSTRENSCCEGQGTRLIGSLPEHIFSVAEDGLYVNLYEPSTIEWKREGVPVGLAMETRFPYEPEVKCRVTTESPVQATIRVRTPSWAVRPMDISVNEQHAGSGQPGSYVAIDRSWRDGDRIAFSLPIGWRARKYVGADQVPGGARYSLEYGPILYAAVGSDAVELPAAFDPEQIAEQLEAMPGTPLHWRIRGVSGVRLVPYWQITDEVFTCFPRLTGKGSSGQANLAM